MERRTVPNYNFGALSSMSIDDPETATSNSSFQLVESLFRSDKRYFIVDEPEIGMGKESILGLSSFLNDKVVELKNNDNWNGMLLITHNEFLIENLKFDRFIDLGGSSSFEEWKNREVNAIDYQKLSNFCLEMWRVISKRSEKK